jgi:hypothetical protein
MHFFYEQQGLSSSYPLLPVVNFFQGMSGLYPYVEATLDFQAVARMYQSNLTGSTPLPYVNAISMDVPWCTFNTSVTCSGRTLYGAGKIDQCLIIDYDRGGDTQTAGRIWIYVKQTGVCAGQSPVVKFFNVTLDNSTTTATYTYDTLGITSPYNHLSLTEALEFYQNSTCDYSDGAISDAVTQKQFVCNDYPMKCAIDRANALGSPPVIPIPQYTCLGNLTPTNMTPVMVWFISSLDLPGSVAGSFFLTFCEGVDQLCRLTFEQRCRLNPGSLQSYTLVPGTRRQFFSPFTSFDQTIVVFYNGKATSFQPLYSLSPFDENIRVIPCICQFSVDCHANGTVIGENSIISSYITPINTPPIANPGPAVVITQGTPTLLMNASASNDPNLLPGFFSTYWKLYSQPPGSPLVSIPFPQSEEFLLDTSQFIPGRYQFVLYASDSQSVTFVIYNVTVIYNAVQISINISRRVQFEPYYGASPTSGATCPTSGNYPSPCIPIDGSGTIASNPNVTLTYLWRQDSGGYPTPIPYSCDITAVKYTAGMLNHTTSILCVIPPNIGLYGYTLTVNDGAKNFSKSIQFYVVPNFITPDGPDLILPNYTRAPPRVLTRPPRTVITWPNISYNLTPPAPWAPPPTTSIYVAPLLPDHGAATRDQLIILVSAFIVGYMMLLIFFAYYILTAPDDDLTYLDQYAIDVDSY